MEANQFFDESTYVGRFRKFLELTNVRHLLHSTEKIKRCQKSIESGENVSRDCIEIVAACVHPSTKEVIPVYGRMASFVPVNIPICAGMLLAAPTLSNLIGWQWINQTYNAVFNYSNSAKSKGPNAITEKSIITNDHKDILKGYIGSVIVSVGLAVGLTQQLKRASLSPSLRRKLQMIVPYTASASAAVANVVLMRRQELSTGIPIHTPIGQYIGHSQAAAKKALTETAISRAVLSIPILLLPPPLISLALRCRVLKSSKILKATTEMSFLIFAIAVGLPSAIALFPQQAQMNINTLEECNRAKAAERNIRNVCFNKGV